MSILGTLVHNYGSIRAAKCYKSATLVTATHSNIRYMKIYYKVQKKKEQP